MTLKQINNYLNEIPEVVKMLSPDVDDSPENELGRIQRECIKAGIIAPER